MRPIARPCRHLGRDSVECGWKRLIHVSHLHQSVLLMAAVGIRLLQKGVVRFLAVFLFLFWGLLALIFGVSIYTYIYRGRDAPGKEEGGYFG
jgi:hypothetical protein